MDGGMSWPGESGGVRERGGVDHPLNAADDLLG
jgi:hypothetical protein